MDLNMIIKDAPEAHIPEKLPIDLSSVLYDTEIISLISKANNAIGAYKGFLINTINPMLLIAPLVTQETVLSSRLEGTHATMEDFINYDAGDKVDISSDEMKEVMNYRKALYYALDNMATKDDNLEEADGKLPLCSRLLKDIHKILLDNVRGKTKHPGELKTEQNYVGSSNEITFTPLTPELTPEFMANLEKYMNSEDIDLLVQAALIHVQFEMIHPFEDGNGRIGRLLIPLFLYYRGILPIPSFYMSAYFAKDRDLYLKKLSAVSKENDYSSWIKYFLEGVIEQAETNTMKANFMLDIYNKYKDICLNEISTKNSIILLDQIFQKPAFKSNHIDLERIGSKGTLYNMLDEFIEKGILKKNDKTRNATYYCPELLSLL